MITSFGSAGTEDVWNGADTKAARKTLDKTLWPVAQRKLDLINAATAVADHRAPPGNRLESLKGSLVGAFSIRINDQFRITFQFSAGNADRVEIVDYH
jgi:proteic killer suppression protein